MWDIPEGGGVKYGGTAYVQYRWARSLHASMDSKAGLFLRKQRCDGGVGARIMRMEEALHEFDVKATMNQLGGMHLRKGLTDWERMDIPN